MEKHADLHVHTSFSDSAYSPEEVLRRAREAGLSAIGICDHDSVKGIEEAVKLEEE
ncbi:MAG: PHP domain-containing protein, partial [Candidatus Hadarchaeales archaeon]